MDFRFAERLKYVVDYPSFVVTFAALMDIDVWNSLTPDVQDIIDELGREMALWTGEYHDNHVQESIEWSIKEEGLEIITLTDEERIRWDNQIQNTTEDAVAEVESKGLPGKEYIERLYELRDKYMEDYS